MVVTGIFFRVSLIFKENEKYLTTSKIEFIRELLLIVLLLVMKYVNCAVLEINVPRITYKHVTTQNFQSIRKIKDRLSDK